MEPLRYEQDYMRGDPHLVSLEELHPLQFIAAEFKCTVGQMYINTAFLQATEFTRKIYVQRSRDAGPKGLFGGSNFPLIAPRIRNTVVVNVRQGIDKKV